jgi:nitronate monooxygenase
LLQKAPSGGFGKTVRLPVRHDDYARNSIGWHGQENALIAAGADERRRYAAAAAAGDVDKAFFFAGERVHLIHEIEPAEVILNRIVTGAESVLAQQFH